MSACDRCGETDLLTPMDILVDGEVRHLLVCPDCEEELEDA